MNPVLLDLGPLRIYSFGVMITAGVLFSLCGMLRDARRTRFLKREEVYDLLFVTLVAGFAGGRFLYVLQNSSFYAEEPWRVLALWEGGLIFYGGVAGALAGVAVFCVFRKIRYSEALDFLTPYVALTHAFGRAGCFLNGCCLGKACDGPWAVRFLGEDVARHPTQLYEAGLLAALFLFLRFWRRRRAVAGELTLGYLSFYAVIRFFIEFAREGNPYYYVLTYNQWISVFILLTAGSLLAFLRLKKTKETAAAYGRG